MKWHNKGPGGYDLWKNPSKKSRDTLPFQAECEGWERKLGRKRIDQREERMPKINACFFFIKTYQCKDNFTLKWACVAEKDGIDAS